MRIAYVSTDPGIAYGGAKGASVHVAELTAALAREGAELLILVARVAPGALPPPRGATLEPLPGPGRAGQQACRSASRPGPSARPGSRSGSSASAPRHSKSASRCTPPRALPPPPGSGSRTWSS